MIHLRTLGPLTVFDDAGRPVVVPPKPMALLAYLAAARPRGPQRRDTLVAMFYPESDARRARGALRQLVSEVRAAVGPEIIQAADREQIRLDPARLDCDLWQLEDALTRGALADGVDACRGEFLAGFHLSGCPEFEAWLSAERARARHACADALERLARAAEADGDPTSAVRWWRRLADGQPHSDTATVGLLRTLEAVGDSGTALVAAEQHARRLQDDLGIAPSAEVDAIVARLKTRPPVSAAAPMSADGNAMPGVSAAAPAEQHRIPGRRSVRRGRRDAIAAAATVLLLAAGWHGSPPPARDGPGGVPPSAYRVAVFPFAVQAAADRLYLGDAVAGLLGDAFDGVGELRRVDQAAVVEHAGRRIGQRLPQRKAALLARDLGARRYVLGTVTDLGDRIRVSASLYDVEAGDSAVATARRDAEPAQVAELAVVLAQALLAHMPLGPSAPMQAITPLRTANPEALREYLVGESFTWRALPDSARAHFLAAVALDSTFALAWYRLGTAQADVYDPRAAFSLGEALRQGSRLSSEDLALAELALARVRGDGIRARELARRAVDAFPASAEAWRSLASAYVWYGWQWGGAPPHARPYFQRALAADPLHYGALLGLTWLALVDRDWATADSLVRVRQAHGVRPDVSDTAMLVIRTMEGGDERRRQRWLGEVATGSAEQIFGFGVNAFRFIDRLDAVTQVFALAADSSTRPRETVVRAHGWIGTVALAGGRWRDASAALDRAERLEPGIATRQRALATALPFMARPPEELRALRETIASLPPEPPGGVAVPEDRSTWGRTPPELARHWRAHLLGLLSARLGDEPAARGYADELERAREPADSAGLLADLALEIRALAAAHVGRDAEALAMLESMEMRIAFGFQTRVSALYHRPLARFLRAELLLRAGRTEEALGWLAWFGTWSTDALYISPVLLRRGEIHERLGHPEDALRDYRRFLTRWRDADPEYQPLVRDVAARIRRLEADGTTR